MLCFWFNVTWMGGQSLLFLPEGQKEFPGVSRWGQGSLWPDRVKSASGPGWLSWWGSLLWPAFLHPPSPWMFRGGRKILRPSGEEQHFLSQSLSWPVPPARGRWEMGSPSWSGCLCQDPLFWCPPTIQCLLV